MYVIRTHGGVTGKAGDRLPMSIRPQEMAEIASTETVLEGRWLSSGGTVHADDVALRIQRLIDHHLKFVASRDGGWAKLYRDPVDGRFWELSYPMSEMHGGGPPRLESISAAIVRSRYGNAEV